MMTILKNSNENLVVYGFVCLAAALACLVLTRYSAIQVSGASAWVKPLKFFLSIGVFAFTMAVYVPLLDNARQVNIYSWSFIVFLSVEVLLITLQAARGRKSHFNVDTPADNLIFGLMGLAIFAILLHTIYISALFFTQKQFAISDHMVLAIQVSLVMMALFALEGVVMVSVSRHTIGGEDAAAAGIPVLHWNKGIGDLRVSHFFGIHALQVIPLLCFFLARNKTDVIIIGALYFLFVTFTFVQALQGKSLFK